MDTTHGGAVDWDGLARMADRIASGDAECDDETGAALVQGVSPTGYWTDGPEGYKEAAEACARFWRTAHSLFGHDGPDMPLSAMPLPTPSLVIEHLSSSSSLSSHMHPLMVTRLADQWRIWVRGPSKASKIADAGISTALSMLCSLDAARGRSVVPLPADDRRCCIVAESHSWRGVAAAIYVGARSAAIVAECSNGIYVTNRGSAHALALADPGDSPRIVESRASALTNILLDVVSKIRKGSAGASCPLACDVYRPTIRSMLPFSQTLRPSPFEAYTLCPRLPQRIWISTISCAFLMLARSIRRCAHCPTSCRRRRCPTPA